MENAFAGFNALEYTLLGCAVVGGSVVLIKLVLQLIGAHDHSGMGVDAHHADSDAGFSFLSLHGLSVFIMMFGLVGLALYRQSRAGLAVTVVGALAAGVVAVWVIGKLFQFAGGLQTSGTLQTKDAVGSTGTVYLTIPAQGTGRVNVDFLNHLREYDAVELNGAELRTGTPIRVVRVDANVMVVERLH